MSEMDCNESDKNDEGEIDIFPTCADVLPEKRQCPTCLQNVMRATYPSHLVHCLRRFQRDTANTVSSKSGSSDLSVKCVTCGKELSHMSDQRRAQHQNRCLDALQTTGTNSVAPPSNSLVDCPICLLRFNSPKARVSHLSRCAKNRGMDTKELLEVVKLQERQTKERLVHGLSIMPPTLKSGPRTRAVQRNKRNYNLAREDNNYQSEEMQVAMAMSLSLQQGSGGGQQQQQQLRKEHDHRDDLLRALGWSTQQKTKDNKGKGRNKNTKNTPLLLLRSEEDRAAIISERVAKVLATTHDDADYYPPYLIDWKSIPPHVSHLEQASDCRLWKLATLSQTLTSDVNAFYVNDLVKFVSPCKVKPGDKLKRLSQVPGYLSQNRSCDNAKDRFCNKTSEADVTSTQNILLNLIDDNGTSYTQKPSQGFFLSQCNDDLSDVEERESEVHQPLKTTSDDNCVQKMQKLTAELQSTLCIEYAGMLLGKESDCHIEVRCKSMIPCHTALLRASWPQIYNELDGEGLIRWKDTSKSTALAFLQFLYFGMISSRDYSSWELEALAKHYNLPEKAMTLLMFYCKLELTENRPNHGNKYVRFEEINEHLVTDDALIVSDNEDNESVESFLGDIIYDDDDDFGDNDFIKDGVTDLQQQQQKSQTEDEDATRCLTQMPTTANRYLETTDRFIRASQQDPSEHAENFNKMPSNIQMTTSEIRDNPDSDSSRSPDFLASRFSDADDYLFVNIDTNGLVGDSQGKKKDDHAVKSLNKVQKTDPTDAFYMSVVNQNVGGVMPMCETQWSNSTLFKATLLTSTPNEIKTKGLHLKREKTELLETEFQSPELFGENKGTIETVDLSDDSQSNINNTEEHAFKRSTESDVLDKSKRVQEWLARESSYENTFSAPYISTGVNNKRETTASLGFTVGFSQTPRKKRLASRDAGHELLTTGDKDNIHQEQLAKKRKICDNSPCSSNGFEIQDNQPSPVKSFQACNSVWEDFYADDDYGYVNCQNETYTPRNSSANKILISRGTSPCESDFTLPTPPVRQRSAKKSKSSEKRQNQPTQAKRKCKQKSSSSNKKQKKNKAKKSITPLPHYSILPTPEVNKALSNIGVRAMPKKKAAKLLTYVYDEMHPLMPCNESKNDTTATTNTTANDSTDKKKKKKKDTNKEISNRSNSRDDQTKAINNFIMDSSKWYEDILQYEVINVKEFQKDLKAAGLNVKMSSLKEYLDQQGIVCCQEEQKSMSKKRKPPKTKKAS